MKKYHRNKRHYRLVKNCLLECWITIAERKRNPKLAKNSWINAFSSLVFLPAFFDLMISLRQKGPIMLLLKSGPNVSKWHNLAGVLVHSTNRFKVWSKGLGH